MKFYAVLAGRKPGIYTSWSECEAQVKGFSNAKFKTFTSYEEAVNYIKSGPIEISDENDIKYPCAFVDGSFNPAKKTYGYGGYIEWIDKNGVKIHKKISGSGTDSKLSAMRNIAGELLGVIVAVNNAICYGLKEINIYYDYSGIEMWANGHWNTKNKFILEYINFICESRKKIKINFFKVKSHSNIKGNEIADKLAKAAVF